MFWCQVRDVAYALLRAASRLSRRLLNRCTISRGVETSLDTARKSAYATYGLNPNRNGSKFPSPVVCTAAPAGKILPVV